MYWNLRHLKTVLIWSLWGIGAITITWKMLIAPKLRWVPTYDVGCDTKNQGGARTNLVFCRVHKTGSSSIQNILFRYGIKHNLTFVLPREPYYLGHPELFHRSLLPETKDPDQVYNQLVHHMRPNYQEVKLLMPVDSLFVTVLRNPVDLFESLYTYYYYVTLGFGASLGEFIDSAPSKPHSYLTQRFVEGRLGVNQQAFDLGLDVADFWRPSVLQKFIAMLDQIFDLVMITERLDESLILLKELVRWDLDDVVGLHLNKRVDALRQNLTPFQRQRLRGINAADQAIYDYFSARFEARVLAFGKFKMAEEVKELRRRVALLVEACVLWEADRYKLDQENKSAFSFSEVVRIHKVRDNETCKCIADGEQVVSKYLRERQKHLYKEYPWNNTEKR